MGSKAAKIYSFNLQLKLHVAKTQSLLNMVSAISARPRSAAVAIMATYLRFCRVASHDGSMSWMYTLLGFASESTSSSGPALLDWFLEVEFPLRALILHPDSFNESQSS